MCHIPRSGADYDAVVSIFAVPSLITLFFSVIQFAVVAFAFIDATRHRPDAFPAVDRGTKTGWLIGLGVAVLAHLLFWNPLSILNLVGIVAALVYVVDVRPSLLAITGRR
jgi:hypothetical protein